MYDRRTGCSLPVSRSTVYATFTKLDVPRFCVNVAAEWISGGLERGCGATLSCRTLKHSTLENGFWWYEEWVPQFIEMVRNGPLCWSTTEWIVLEWMIP